MGNADKKSQRSPFSCPPDRILLQDPLERAAANPQPPCRLPERNARLHQGARLRLLFLRQPALGGGQLFPSAAHEDPVSLRQPAQGLWVDAEQPRHLSERGIRPQECIGLFELFRGELSLAALQLDGPAFRQPAVLATWVICSKKPL